MPGPIALIATVSAALHGAAKVVRVYKQQSRARQFRVARVDTVQIADLDLLAIKLGPQGFAHLKAHASLGDLVMLGGAS